MSVKFVEYSGKRFPLDEGMTLDDAKDVMARHFPELAEPEVKTKKEGEVTVYEFSKKVGKKGAPKRDRRVKSVRVMVRRLLLIKTVEQAPSWTIDAIRTFNVGVKDGDAEREVDRLEADATRAAATLDGLQSIPSLIVPGSCVL